MSIKGIALKAKIKLIEMMIEDGEFDEAKEEILAFTKNKEVDASIRKNIFGFLEEYFINKQYKHILNIILNIPKAEWNKQIFNMWFDSALHEENKTAIISFLNKIEFSNDLEGNKKLLVSPSSQKLNLYYEKIKSLDKKHNDLKLKIYNILADRRIFTEDIIDEIQQLDSKMENVDTFQKAADYYFNKREYKKAFEIYEKLKSKGNDEPALLRNMGDIYFLQGEYFKAKDNYTTALKDNSLKEELEDKLQRVEKKLLLQRVSVIKSEIARKENKTDSNKAGILKEAEKWRKDYSFKSVAHLKIELGKLFIDVAGELDQAITLFQQLLQDDEMHEEAHKLLGFALIKKGAFSTALTRFKQLIVKNEIKSDEDKAFFYSVGEEFEEHGAYDEAIDIFTEIEAIDLYYRDTAERIRKIRAADRQGSTDKKGVSGKRKLDIVIEAKDVQEWYVGKTCPYCQGIIKPGIPVIVCGECNIPHHQECWEENGGCTTYGCSGV